MTHTVLGLDYGAKHIGVAVADGPLAQPLKMIPRKNAVAFIGQLCGHFKVSEIVIGLPDGSIRQEVMDFIKHELGILKLPVHPVDETLSSHDARQALLHASVKKRKLGEHAAAAAIILQNWLDTEDDTLVSEYAF